MGVVHACEQKNNLRTPDLTKKRREVPTSTGLLMKLAWGARWKPLAGGPELCNKGAGVWREGTRRLP